MADEIEQTPHSRPIQVQFNAGEIEYADTGSLPDYKL